MIDAIRVTASSVPEPYRRAFVEDVERVGGSYDRLRRERGLPDCAIELVLTDDLTSDVRALNARAATSDGTEFTTERVGGVVAAKCMPLDEEWARLVILFDAAGWRPTEGGHVGFQRVHQIFLVAHELAHPLLTRARRVAGVARPSAVDGFPTAAAQMNGLGRVLADEYRADRLADREIARAVSHDAGDGPVTTHLVDLFGNGYAEQIGPALDQTSTAWPRLLCAHRRCEVGDGAVWDAVARGTEGVLMLLAHAQALADTHEPTDLFGARGEDQGPPAAGWFGPPWNGFVGVLRGQPLLPAMEEFRGLDDEIGTAGAVMARRIWEVAGLAVNDLGERDWTLAVLRTAPG